MTKFQRPRRNVEQDKNHMIVPKAIKNRLGGAWKDEFNVWHAHIHGLRVSAIDTSKFGGEMLDWLVQVSWFPIYFEVKSEEQYRKNEVDLFKGRLKPGEVAFFHNVPAVAGIVKNEDEVYFILELAANMVEEIESKMSLTKSYIKLFFPKIDREEKSNSEETNEDDR